MIPIPASLRFDFIHIPGMLIHIAPESTIHIVEISTLRRTRMHALRSSTVSTRHFGINLDITNFIPTAKADAYAQIEATVPYATHSHVRDRFENGQAADLERVWQIFARSNYKGFMSAEYEGDEDPSTGVSKLVDKIKALSRKYSSV